MHIYLAQIFEFGYFHADPHPGNVIINSEGVIRLIDFGMIGRLNKTDKFSFAGIFIGMAQKNARKMAQNLSRLATEHDIDDHKRLERDCAALIDDFADLDLEESNIAELGTRLQKIIYDYRLKVPGGVFLILRALAILEGIGKQLSPGMNAYEEVKPYGLKLMREQYSFQNIMEEVTWRISSFDQLLRSFPVEVTEILKTVRKGKLHIETESVHHEESMQRIERTGDRIVMALLVAGLAIAGSISMWAPTGPLSPATMTLFIAAAVVMVVLLVRSLRN
jgi:ubiquinone biosynthesis protein